MRLFEVIDGSLFTYEDMFEGTKEEFIAKQMGNKITAAAEKDHSFRGNAHDPINVVGELSKFDPTPNKAYLQWLAKQYANGTFKMEDDEMVVPTIKLFNTYKNRLDNKDINSYARMADLHRAVQPFKDATAPASRKEDKRSAKIEGATPIINTPNFKVYDIHTHKAACLYGANTTWCTTSKDPSKFDEYLKDGKIYTIIAKDPETGKDRKFQLHYEADQFMDEMDDPAPAKDIKFLSQFPQWKEFLEDLTIKHYGAPPEK